MRGFPSTWPVLPQYCLCTLDIRMFLNEDSFLTPLPSPKYHYPCAEVAQSVEHMTENHGVGSSILPLGTPLSPKTTRCAVADVSGEFVATRGWILG